MDSSKSTFAGAVVLLVVSSLMAAPTLTKVWAKKTGGGCENGEISPDGKYVAVAENNRSKWS